ncbi:uncharacterized protein LOC110428915, partial [Herrania umbratica]|uniref:Uncharacterized protein LOC110428915 n=1 Tax=Herrania umbratica TaxID=108875 RepID=A0A6J1BN36_9ROSI
MPKLNDIRTAFKGIWLSGAFEIRWLDYKHVLIHLTNEHDLNQLWLRQNWFIANQKMRVFKWSLDFQSEKELSFVPVWISFPGLRAHLFEKSTLLMIAKTVGRPFFVVEATANGLWPSVARVCVEYDCQKPPLDQVWIVTRDRRTGYITGGFTQKVEFSKLPPYCTHCCHVGHEISACMVLGNKPQSTGTLRQKSSLESNATMSKTQRIEKEEIKVSNPDEKKDKDPLHPEQENDVGKQQREGEGYVSVNA